MTKPEFIARCRQLFKPPKNVEFKDFYAVARVPDDGTPVTPVATDGEWMLIFRKEHDSPHDIRFTCLEDLQSVDQSVEPSTTDSEATKKRAELYEKCMARFDSAEDGKEKIRAACDMVVRFKYYPDDVPDHVKEVAAKRNAGVLETSGVSDG